MDQHLKDLRDRMVLKDQLDALAPILPERCYWSHAIQNVDLEALKTMRSYDRKFVDDY